MSQFTMADALKLCMANVNSRKSVQRSSYILYYSNDAERYAGKIVGSTVKALINEFRTTYGTYQYAVITKVGDPKPIRFYNRSLSKKFFSMTRKPKSN